MSLPVGIDPRFTAAMGKVDDMRRLREERFAQNEREAKAREAAAVAAARGATRPGKDGAAVAVEKLAAAAPAEDAADAEDAAAPAEDAANAAAPAEDAANAAAPAAAEPVGPSPRGKRRAVDEQGACSVCKKVRPLHNGLVSSHQKGLGKVCPGSRKPPG